MAGSGPDGASVSIVVPVHDGASTLGVQLDAVAREVADRNDVEVVVADHASTDDSAHVATSRAAQLPLVVVSVPGGGGPARARNHGVRAATGALILMVDADDRVQPGWLEAMLDGLATAKVVGGRLDTDCDLNVAGSAGARTVQRAALPRFLDVPFSLTASIGFHKSAWEAVGGFDETFFVGEDCDFGLRLARAGIGTDFVPGAVVDYRIRATLGAAARQGFEAGMAEYLLYRRFGTSADFSDWFGRAVKEVVLAALSFVRRLVVRRGPQWQRAAAGRRLGRAVGRIAGTVKLRGAAKDDVGS